MTDHRPSRTHLIHLILGGAIAMLIWNLAAGLSAALRQRNHDFNCFHEAAVALHAGADIYTAGIHGYIYPPMIAVMVAPLGRLDLQTAAVIWALFNAALIPLVAYLAARNAADRMGGSVSKSALWPVAALSVIMLGPVLTQELKDGNCNLIVLLAIVGAQRCLGTRPILCGLLLGFAINIKYLPIVFLPYLLIRGRWKELASTCIGVVLIALAPALVYGWERNLRYLRTAYNGVVNLTGGKATGPAANIHELTWSRSISLPSVFARIADQLHLPHSVAWATLAILAALCVAGAWWIYKRAGIPLFIGRSTQADDTNPVFRAMVALEWPGLFLAALVFSPQTVVRHMNMALPFVAVCAWMVIHGRTPHRTRLMAALWLVCIGTFFRFWIQRDDGPPDPWRNYGGLSWCMILLGFWALWQGTREARLIATPNADASVARKT